MSGGGTVGGLWLAGAHCPCKHHLQRNVHSGTLPICKSHWFRGRLSGALWILWILIPRQTHGWQTLCPILQVPFLCHGECPLWPKCLPSTWSRLSHSVLVDFSEASPPGSHRVSKCVKLLSGVFFQVFCCFRAYIYDDSDPFLP